MKAIWNNTVIAESDDTIVIEGNHYFPYDSLKHEFYTPTKYHTHCPWKGDASYYSVNVDGKEGQDVAWYYADPKEGAAHIKGRVAFWRGVEVVS